MGIQNYLHFHTNVPRKKFVFYKTIMPVPNYYIPVCLLRIYISNITFVEMTINMLCLNHMICMYFRTNNFEKVAGLVIFVQGD